jgi:hypothetical protein
MFRSAVSKVMWVGRATVFLVGLAVILALLFGVASMAFARDGQSFILGQRNVAQSLSTLVRQGAGPALSLQVDSGAPLAVNSDAQVDNLNADQLDGKDQRAFADVNELDSATVISRWAELPTQGTYTSEGGTLVISAAGSGYRAESNTRTVGDIGMRILVDGTERGQALLHANELQSHKPFVARQVVVKGLAAGSHTIRLEELYEGDCNTAEETRFTACTTTNTNDRFEVSVLEIAD